MMKIIGWTIAIIVGGTLLGFTLKVIFFPVYTGGKLIKTGYDTVDKTLNAENAIYNYEWFKQQKESIDATNRKLQIADEAISSFEQIAGKHKNWTFEDKNESSRLRAVSQGIENQLKDMIAEYNARTKMVNRSIFQDGILPNFIDATTFIIKN